MARLWGRKGSSNGAKEDGQNEPGDSGADASPINDAGDTITQGDTAPDDGASHDSTDVARPVGVGLEKSAMNTTIRSPFTRHEAGSSSGAPTVIRAGLHLEGNIRTADDILLEGSVRGEVTANSITVAAGATLSGNVSAAVIIIDGLVEGVVRCIKLQVNTTGAVAGEIHHSVMVVEAGASIQGTVFRTERHSEVTESASAVTPTVTPGKFTVVSGPDTLETVDA